MKQLDLFPRREYSIYLDKKNGPECYTDFIPDEIPNHVLDLICDVNVDKKLGLCGSCAPPEDVPGRICHVLILDEDHLKKYGQEQYKLYCPILFQDLINPPWKVEDVLK